MGEQLRNEGLSPPLISSTHLCPRQGLISPTTMFCGKIHFTPCVNDTMEREGALWSLPLPLSLSRKLQSSLAFKGNYSDEPVICSGVGIMQSSPESSCMKKLEDPSEKNHREKRGDAAEDKKGPCFTPQDTGVGATTAALSLWIWSFLWTPGPRSGSTSTPCSCRSGGGKALPTSQEPQRGPHNSKGSCEVPALDLKRAVIGKSIFKKCQIYKNLHQFSFPIFLVGTCRSVLWIPVVWVSVNSREGKHHIHISKAVPEQSRSRAEHYSLKVALIMGNEHLLKW